ncbi:polyprenyl synthetase family protein [Dermabacteraceae bacterium P13128]
MAGAPIPDIDEALANELQVRLEKVEERLRRSVHTADSLAQWTSTYLMDAGGKRVRPMLVLLAASLGEVSRPEVIDAAVVVELTHLATLYHDDVMDSAPTRRGAPSAHEVWGNSVAILTGDFLFARASSITSSLGPEAVRIHASTFERLCLGQLHETVGPEENEDPYQHYISVLADKTGSLIAASARYGAMFGGCDAQTTYVMEEYGEKIGIAFQLADDVIDIRSDGSKSGKTPGTDLREGVPTMPSLLVRKRYAEGDTSEATKAIIAALDADLSGDEALAHAVALLREDEVLKQTEELAREYAAGAVQALQKIPAGPVRSALESFAWALVDRAS